MLAEQYLLGATFGSAGRPRRSLARSSRAPAPAAPRPPPRAPRGLPSATPAPPARPRQGPVPSHRARRLAGRREAGAQRHRVEPTLEALEDEGRRVAALRRDRLVGVVLQLPSRDAVGEAHLLELAELFRVGRGAAATAPGHRLRLRLGGKLRVLGFLEDGGAEAAGNLVAGSDAHKGKLNAARLAALRAVVRHRRPIDNRTNLHPARDEAANGRLASGADALHHHVDRLDAERLRLLGENLRRLGGGERRALLGAGEPERAGGGVGDRVASGVREHHLRVVEGGEHVERTLVQTPLGRLCLRRLRQRGVRLLLGFGYALLSHMDEMKIWLLLLLDALARAHRLPDVAADGAGVGLRSLAADRQAAGGAAGPVAAAARR